MKKWLFLLLFPLPAFAQEAEKAVYTEFSAKVSAEYRSFFEPGLYAKQRQNYLSGALQPEFSMDWDDATQRVQVELFGRLSTFDDQRTRWDVREMYYQLIRPKWELSAGVKKLYWGVTEAAHLVDVINQTDLVENQNGESKLGQPLVQFTWLADWGSIDVIGLTYHRQLTFPGEGGRLRFPEVIDQNTGTYESDLEEWHPEVAVRYSHSLGIADFGVHYMYGTARQPTFVFEPTGQFGLVYELMNQTGIDLQLTQGAMLWKLEGLYRDQKSEDITTFDAGFEYTFSNVFNAGFDIGALGEYIYDSRGELAITGLDNDVFVGTRLAFNDSKDTQVLIGGIADLEQSGKIFSIEASRRFYESWTAEIQAQLLTGIDNEELFYPLRNDSYAQFTLFKYF